VVCLVVADSEVVVGSAGIDGAEIHQLQSESEPRFLGAITWVH
jgi:hypothetical protein